MNTKRIFVKNLNANQTFLLPGNSTLYVCESRRTMDNMTRVGYRIMGDDTGLVSEFVKVNMSTVDVVTD